LITAISWIFPIIRDSTTAMKVSRQGFGAAVLIVTANVVKIFFISFDMAQLIYAILFVVIALGIYKMYRIAAVAGLFIYLSGRFVIWYNHGFPDAILRIIILIILMLMFINAIRGTFAYHSASRIQPS